MTRIVALVVLVLASILVGCGPSSTPVTGNPPGTAITPWLVSPPGTLLLGRTFPDRDGGFFALALVTGDAVAVARDLARQLDAADFTVFAGCSAGRDGTSDSTDVEVRGSPIPGAARLRCTLTAYRGKGEPAAALRVELDVAADGEPYTSHLKLWYFRQKKAPSYEPPPEIPDVPAPVRAEAPPAAPGVGDLVTEEQPAANRGSESLRVVEGSRMLAPVYPLCGSVGFYAVFQVVADDVDRVVDAHVAYYAELHKAVEQDRVRFTVGDAHVEQATFSWAGGGDALVEAVSRPGEPTYLLIRRCGD